jgi:hypothetical protein
VTATSDVQPQPIAGVCDEWKIRYVQKTSYKLRHTSHMHSLSLAEWRERERESIFMVTKYVTSCMVCLHTCTVKLPTQGLAVPLASVSDNTVSSQLSVYEPIIQEVSVDNGIRSRVYASVYVKLLGVQR